jgi:hypothetical protein
MKRLDFLKRLLVIPAIPIIAKEIKDNPIDDIKPIVIKPYYYSATGISISAKLNEINEREQSFNNLT